MPLDGAGDGSVLTPPIESDESDPSEVFESEEPEDSKEMGTEGTEGTSWGVGGPRYEDNLEETYEDSSSSDVDESEGEDSDSRLRVSDCSTGSTSIGPLSGYCSVPMKE